ncbi:MAG TPA: hypothetical protein VLD63_15450 [Anaerolineales bacterium]|nr:hypothetical protein [Anaerolineales bacterium]
MIRRRLATVSLSLIVAASLGACNLPLGLLGPSSDGAATQTLAALATQVQATLVGLPTPAEVTAVPSATPIPPGEPSATPTIPPSPTAVSPVARVNENTNCRTGPGTIYDHDYTALKGSALDIVGQSSVPEYVIVAVPGEPGHTCWLWTRYVTVEGDLSRLPVSTPPPTPTPSLGFTLSYSYMEGCVGWDPGFKVVNTGNVAFLSGKVKAKDTDTDTTESDTTDVFDKRNGCAVDHSIPQLDPGDTGYIYANSFLYDPTGNDFEATVTLCTGPGLTGQCITKSISGQW